MTRLAGSRSGRWACVVCGAFATGAAGGAVGAGGACVAAAIGLGGAAIVVALVRTAGCPPASARGVGTAALLALVAAMLTAGVLRAAAAAPAAGAQSLAGHLGARPIALTGTVREGQSTPGGPVIVDAERLTDAGSDGGVSGGVLVSGALVPDVMPGDRVEVDASGLRAPNLRPGPESAATLEREGVEAVAIAPLVSVTGHGAPSPPRAVAWAQRHLVAAVDGILPEPQAALTLGIAFGIRQPLSDEVRQPLQDAGLIHVVVVSGLKVVMVLTLVATMARALGWPPRRSLLLAVPVVAGYVLLSGAGPAAVRSAVMAGAALLARHGGRRADPLPMLALTAAVMLGIDPVLVRDPGFQLSFLGTAGILLLADPLVRRLPGPRLLVEPFAVTVAAQAATLPVMAGTFGVIALLGPVANALLLPLLPALIVLGGAGAVAGCLAPALAWPLLHLAGLGATLAVVIAQVTAAVPGAALHIATWPPAWTAAEIAGLAAAALAVLLSGRRGRFRVDPGEAAVGHAGAKAGAGGRHRPAFPASRRPASRRRSAVASAAAAAVCAGCVAGYAASRPDGALHVTVLSTGAAPAVLVRGADGSLALVDGGSSPTALLQALGRVLGPTEHRLDLVVVSGGELTAVAGLAALPQHYGVGTVLASGSLNPGGARVVAALRDAGASPIDPSGRAWIWGGSLWRCLPFRAQATDRAECVVSVRSPTGSVLVLGDAGSGDQEELAAAYGPALGANLLVAEPGGALALPLLMAARPAAIVVPTAAGGQASPAPSGYTVLRTATQGDLRFDGGARGLVLGP